jgi:hypothetical protein
LEKIETMLKNWKCVGNLGKFWEKLGKMGRFWENFEKNWEKFIEQTVIVNKTFTYESKKRCRTQYMERPILRRCNIQHNDI